MNINYWAVLVSAIVSMVIGGIWYGPLFGKLYIREQGWDKHTAEQKKEMMKDMEWSYLWQFIASLITFYVLAFFIQAMQMPGIMTGIKVAVLIWAGFVATLIIGDVLWGGKKTLFWLKIGNTFLTMLAAGVILGVWR